MGITIPISSDFVLRSFEEADASATFELVEKNRAHLRQWLPWVDTTLSVADQKEFISRSLAQLDMDNGFQAGIWYSGELVGTIGFHYIDRIDRKTEIGYLLAASAQGKGLMTRACRAMVDYAFHVYRLNRVEIQAASENLRSRAIPERLGFSMEGVKREDGWLYDHFVDHVIYAMLASNWRS